MASSSKRSTSPTPKDDKEKEEPDHKKHQLDRNQEPEPEEDDSDETLSILRGLETPNIPPGWIVHPGSIALCSKPLRKQLTKKDVNVQEEMKLGLPKSQLTKEFVIWVKGKEWKVVSVYGPDGKVHEMKMWFDEKNDMVELKKGWSKFVADYHLKEFYDFITVWMFMNKDRNEISLAIDTKRLNVTKPVSQRISKAVFDDSD